MTAETTRRRSVVGVLVALALVATGAPWTGHVASAQDPVVLRQLHRRRRRPRHRHEPHRGVRRDRRRAQRSAQPRADRLAAAGDGVRRQTGWRVRPCWTTCARGLRRFVDALPADIEVAIATIGGRPQFRVRHTTGPDRPRGRGRGDRAGDGRRGQLPRRALRGGGAAARGRGGRVLPRCRDGRDQRSRGEHPGARAPLPRDDGAPDSQPGRPPHPHVHLHVGHRGQAGRRPDAVGHGHRPGDRGAATTG